MKHLSHITLLLIIGVLFSFTSDIKITQQATDAIHWGKKLKWTDFRGPIPSDSKFHALTHSVIDLKFEGEDKYLTFEIKSIFVPSKSWKKEGVNDYVLKHEQIHFDITEYHSRLLRKNLKTHKYKNVNSIEQEVKDMFHEAFEKANKMQLKYDSETNHSINKKKQNKWNKKVKKYLQSTSSYKNPKIKVNVGYLLQQ